VYQQARAYVAEAEAGLYPQVGLGAQFSGNRQSNTRPLRIDGGGPDRYGAQTIDAAASYEVDLWGQVRNAVAAGKTLAKASAADLATTRLSLHAELASDYFALRGLDAQLDLLASTVEAYQRALELTQARFSGRIASGMDVARAQTQLDAARTEVSDVEAQRDALQDAIASLIGQPASSFSLARAELTETTPDIPTGVPSTLLQRRPDIVSAEEQVQAANAMIGVAKAAFYPTLILTATGGFNSTGLNLLQLPDSMWSIGPTLAFPLFEGGLRDAEEKSAWAKLHQSVAFYRASVLQAFEEVEDNLSLIYWGRRELADAQAGEEAAAHTLSMAMDLYRNGANSYLEVVTAQTALLQAQQTVIDLRARLLEADVALVRALGGGWDRHDLDKKLPKVQEASE
jgi:NodT family efflux transporter outer membrane factor (OMF) lipoprotein